MSPEEQRQQQQLRPLLVLKAIAAGKKDPGIQQIFRNIFL